MANAAKRFEELDVFRGLAAITVAISHLLCHFQASYGFHNAPGWVREVSPAVKHFSGLLPVAFFFIISGFVIYMSVERCATWRDFAVSRASRLYPAYWAALVLAILLVIADVAGQSLARPTLSETTANIFMVQGLLQMKDIDPVYWSLAYELKFYVLMALILFSPLHRYFDRILIIWLTAALVAAIATRGGIEVPLAMDYFNLTYAHFFAAGIVFYRLWQGDRAPCLWAMLAVCAVIPFLQWPVPAALVAVTLMTVFWFALTGALRFIAVKPLIFLGSISYTLYLVHLPLGHTIEHLLNALYLPALLIVPATLAIVIAVAAVVTYWVERPAMAFIRRLYGQRRQSHPNRQQDCVPAV